MGWFSAADDTREKHRLVGRWIETLHQRDLTGSCPYRSSESPAGEFFEPSLGISEGLGVKGTEIVAGVATVIHNNLRSHGVLLLPPFQNSNPLAALVVPFRGTAFLHRLAITVSAIVPH
jgi:hypothetical protein